MKATLLLGLLAIAAVARADDWSNIGASCPTASKNGTAGGWTNIDLRDAKKFANLTTLIADALRAYATTPDAAKILSQLTCSQDDVDLELNYACQQVVAGMNYKIGFGLECNDDEENIQLEALIYVPVDGSKPKVNVTQKAVACSAFDSTDAQCYFGTYELDCDAYSPKYSGTNVSATVECNVYNKTVVGKPVYTFYCPVSVNTATNAISASCDLPTSLPSDLRTNILTILEQWKAVPRVGNFFDDDSDDRDDSNDGNDNDDDNNDRRKFARLF